MIPTNNYHHWFPSMQDSRLCFPPVISPCIHPRFPPMIPTNTSHPWFPLMQDSHLCFHPDISPCIHPRLPPILSPVRPQKALLDISIWSCIPWHLDPRTKPTGCWSLSDWPTHWHRLVRGQAGGSGRRTPPRYNLGIPQSQKHWSASPSGNKQRLIRQRIYIYLPIQAYQFCSCFYFCKIKD